MDTSESYIKMCEKAEEIQEYALPLLVNKEPFYKSIFICSVCRTETGNCIAHPDLDKREHISIWLPRQDQLQEMLSFPAGSFKDNFWSALADFTEWGYREKWLDWIPLSMEQLWLAFVMRQLHSRVWNGGEWIPL